MVSRNNDGCKRKWKHIGYGNESHQSPTTMTLKKHLVYYTNKDKNEYFAPNGQSKVWACSMVPNWPH